MRITELRVAGYRSIRELRIPFQDVNVIVGPNGVGKSNLYRSVLLLSAASRGELARALAAEGGMPSVLWAGPRKQSTRKPKPVRLRLGLTLEGRQGAFEYDLACGLPIPSETVFGRDPEVKEETVGLPRRGKRPVLLLERRNDSAFLRDGEGQRVTYPLELSRSESVISQLQDPHRYPELSMLRETFRAWRFYHQVRTDADAPVRQPRVAVRTPVLADDGGDLASALETIREMGDPQALGRAIQRGLPQVSQLELPVDAFGRIQVWLRVHGLEEPPGRPLQAQELSDGTLRYLCLCAALLTPRPPLLMALNEPETSLHPDLIEPLAELIAAAARRSQLWITTHSQALAEAIRARTGQAPLALEMVGGETRVAGQAREELEW